MAGDGPGTAGNRWWHLLFGVTMAVIAGIFAANLIEGASQDWIGLVAIAVLVVAYVTVGQVGFRSFPAAVVFLGIMVVCSGVATAADANMALVQCIALPLLWIQLERTRTAVIGNVVLVAAIAAGMFVFLGATTHGLVEVVLIEGISLAGSLCLGLWISRISDLSVERQRLLDELRAAQDQVAALSHDAGATGERERLAREIHDTIAQSLTGVVMLGQRAQRELAAGDDDRAGETLVLLEETARDTLVEARSLVASSAPVDLDSGLVSALHRLARRFERETGVRVAVATDIAEGIAEGASAVTSGRDLEVVILRCAQEALANVRKHAGAVSAEVSLAREGESLVLSVRDDGRGFAADDPQDGFGLAGMRARLGLVGGRLNVVSGASAGTTLRVTVPASRGAGAVGAAVPPAGAVAPAVAVPPAAAGAPRSAS